MYEKGMEDLNNNVNINYEELIVFEENNYNNNNDFFKKIDQDYTRINFSFNDKIETKTIHPYNFTDFDNFKEVKNIYIGINSEKHLSKYNKQNKTVYIIKKDFFNFLLFNKEINCINNEYRINSCYFDLFSLSISQQKLDRVLEHLKNLCKFYIYNIKDIFIFDEIICVHCVSKNDFVYIIKDYLSNYSKNLIELSLL